MRKFVAGALFLSLLLVTGCGGSSSDTTQGGFGPAPSPTVPPASPTPTPSPVVSPTPVVPGFNAQPLFNPLAQDPSQIPVPNDLLRNPQTGLVDQFPNTPPYNAEPFTSLRTIQGFSTSGNIVIPFTGGVNASSVNGSTLIVFDTKTKTPVNCTYAVVQPFITGQTTNSTVFISPVRPMNAATTHLVIVTGNVTGLGGAVTSSNTIALTKLTTPLVDSTGTSTVAGVSNATAAGMEPIRVAYQPIWVAAEGVTGTTRANIPFAFTFGTQPEFFTLQALRGAAVAANTSVSGASIIANSTAVVQGFYNTTLKLPAVAAANVGRIFQGNITMPNYIANASTGFFVGNGTAGNPVQVQSTRAVPFFACFPDPAVAPGPRPCVIFQHGYTRSRNDIFAVASGICSAGLGVIAIDLPDHGALDPVPVTSPSPSTGSLFINPASPRTFRDNFRQGAVDLFYVAQAVVSGQTNLDGVAGPEFAPLPPVLMGTDFGGMVVSLASAVDANEPVIALNVPGGRISNILLSSPTIQAGLGPQLLAAGLVPNTPTYIQFFLLLQNIVDDGDAFNYASHLTAGDLKGNSKGACLLQEYVGDTFMPNSATEDLARSLNGSQVGPAVTNVTGLTVVNAPFPGSGLFQFKTATTGALLNPAAGPTVAIQTQILTYLGSGIPAVANATIVNVTQ